MTPAAGAATAQPIEEVVLLDEDGRAIGTAPKATVHSDRTPRHLAFSCYLFDGSESWLLLTRRAWHKRTWPGVWTNSFCGHPAPGEELGEAVRRRAAQELGVEVTDLRLVLPEFGYQAQMPDGTRENESCPVFVGRVVHQVSPDPEEVADHEWVSWSAFTDEVAHDAREVSPWCVEQVTQLVALEQRHGRLPTGDPARLPPAARLPA